MPGSFTDLMVYRGAGQETVAAFRARWGLNDPLYVQYWRYVQNAVLLDFGTSLQYREPVVDLVGRSIFNSFILVAPGVTAAYLLGSVLGATAGNNRGTFFEKYGILPVVVIGTFPEFFTAILLILIFSLWLGWFPATGMLSTEVSVSVWWHAYLTRDFAMHYVLPFVAVMLRLTYLPMLIMRTNVVEVSNQNFVQYFRQVGLPQRDRFRKIVKHASLPVITLYPISMTRSLSGLVLIETVFNWPGIGYMLVQSVLARDFPVIQFVFFLVAVFVILGNFGIDILYGVIDPRVSVGDSSS
jgi:peptide/nickel transport system permease protein